MNSVARPLATINIRAVSNAAPRPGEAEPYLALSDIDKVELGRIAEIIEFKTIGSRIHSRGERADFLYLLGEGVVEVDHTMQDGARQILAFYWPGDLLGLAENGVYVNSAQTLTKCAVYRFPVQTLRKILLDNARLQHEFLIKALHDLRAAQHRLIAMGRLNVLQRLAAFLIDCTPHECYFDAERRVLSLPMTRYDIADYIGTSAEGVTRAFSRLEAKGLLHRLTPRKLELHIAELRAFAKLSDF
jgi:CRP-like cAMP-binding protein